MSKLLLEIGEHILEVETKSEEVSKQMQQNFQHVSPPYQQPPDLILTIEPNYGVPFQNYDVEIVGQQDQVTFRRADYLIEATCDYSRAKISVHNELALKHALMNLYSSYIVYHNWGLLIHSSCVIQNRGAYIFSGHSGAGKSTIARLSSPRELFSDEATIVKITADEVTAFNSPFQSELQATKGVQSCPISSIQLLYQDIHTKQVPLRKADALLQLMDKVFYWSHDPDETIGIMRLVRSLVENAPVYELHFQKNNLFWELIS